METLTETLYTLDPSVLEFLTSNFGDIKYLSLCVIGLLAFIAVLLLVLIFAVMMGGGLFGE